MLVTPPLSESTGTQSAPRARASLPTARTGGWNRLGHCLATAVHQRFAWSFVATLIIADVAWGAYAGIRFDGNAGIVCAVAYLLALAGYSRRLDSRLGNSVEAFALWFALIPAECVFTYLGATHAAPLQDVLFSAADHKLGFDWLTWYDCALDSPTFFQALIWAYESPMPQIVLACAALPFLGKNRQCVELLILSAAGTIITTLVSAAWPAIGPVASINPDLAPHLNSVLALRSGHPLSFKVLELQGTVVFPSFHTVLAILLSYAFRGTGWLGWGVISLNAFMMLSILPIGGHYLCDMLAAVPVAFFCILGARMSLKWPEPRFFANSALGQQPVRKGEGSRGT